MEYDTPTVEIVGPASQLIQGYASATYDGNGYVYNQGLTCSALEGSGSGERNRRPAVPLFSFSTADSNSTSNRLQ